MSYGGECWQKWPHRGFVKKDLKIFFLLLIMLNWETLLEKDKNLCSVASSVERRQAATNTHGRWGVAVFENRKIGIQKKICSIQKTRYKFYHRQWFWLILEPHLNLCLQGYHRHNSLLEEVTFTFDLGKPSQEFRKLPYTKKCRNAILQVSACYGDSGSPLMHEVIISLIYILTFVSSKLDIK